MEEQKNLNFETIQKDPIEEVPEVPQNAAEEPKEEAPAPEMPAERPIAWNGEWRPANDPISVEAASQPTEEPVAGPSEPQVPAQDQMPGTQAFAQGQPVWYGAPGPYSGQPGAGQAQPGQATFWQEGYSYQNPNPYQNYQWQAPAQPVKKDRNRPFIIAAIIAAVIIALCSLAVVLVELKNFDKWLDSNHSVEGIVDIPFGEKEESEKAEGSDEESAQRQDGAVYNAPEISTEKKKGDALSLIEINKKVKDSVVGILVAQSGEEAKFSGSGFIISEDGYIITNEHVVSEATKVKVVLSDGITEYQAVIVGKDTQADLAILKVEAKGLAAASIGDSDELEVGETVVAIGNPYGMVLAGSLTDGIVSALNRKIEINGSFMTLIQTNASINPGNSGGPLVNAYGQVVGICSSKLVSTEYEGIGFAIPINDVVNLADELINYGYIRTRAYIGIMGSDLQEDYCKYHGIPQGVYVSYVDPECEAAKKGMKEGDIIIGFNGQELTSMAQLNELKNEFRPGDTVKVKVWREKKELEFEITLQESGD